MPTSDQLGTYGLREGNFDHRGMVCAICLSPTNESVVTACQHVFCWHCLASWLRDHVSCPTCRNDLFKARGQLSTAQVMRSAASNQIRDLSHTHVSGTLEQGAIGEAIRETPNPPVLNIPPSRFITLSTLSAEEFAGSQSQRSEYPTTPHASLSYHTPTNDGVSRGEIPTPTRQTSDDILLRAAYNRNPPEYSPHSTIENDIINDEARKSVVGVVHAESPSIVIDSHRMLGFMRAEANKLASERGISQRQDYWQAAKVVYKHWARVLGRKNGQSMLKYDLIWLLAEEMNVARAEAAIVDSNRGEVMPQRLSKYLRDVARAAVDV